MQFKKFNNLKKIHTLRKKKHELKKSHFNLFMIWKKIRCEEKNYKSIFPPIEFCGDNAAMIAMVGLEKFKINQFDDLDYPAKPRWPLDEDAAFLKGAGVQL